MAMYPGGMPSRLGSLPSCWTIHGGEGERGGDRVGERESMCSGGGDMLPLRFELMLRCAWKSCASEEDPSTEKELDERPDGEKSSKEVRREDRDVRELIPNMLGWCRRREGPGSLSIVAKEIEDTRLRLFTSDEDIEWSSSNSRRRAFATRSAVVLPLQSRYR